MTSTALQKWADRSMFEAQEETDEIVVHMPSATHDPMGIIAMGALGYTGRTTCSSGVVRLCGRLGVLAVGASSWAFTQRSKDSSLTRTPRVPTRKTVISAISS